MKVEKTDASTAANGSRKQSMMTVPAAVPIIYGQMINALVASKTRM